MAYDNLTNIQTSKSGTWDTGTSEFYYGDIISLESGIPHKDQLEVERIFSLPSSPVDVANNITVFDLHRIFIVNKNDYSVNETTSKITSLTPSNPTTRYYTLTGGGPGITGTVVTIPTIVNGEAIVVRRKTFSSGKYVTWSAGTRLTSEQLNLQMNQLIKINQELIYKLESEYLRSSDISGTSAPSFTVDNDLDMNGNKITELANPSDATDAVNKQYADAQYVKVGDSVAQSITGAKTFSGAAVFQNTVTMDSSLLVTGMTTLNGGLTMDTNKFLVANDTGNTTVGGTLNVTGATVLSSTLNAGASTLASASVTGALTVDTTTLVVDASNNRVGIGTATPSVSLHVVKATATEVRTEATDSDSYAITGSKADGATIDIRSYGTLASGALIAGQSRADMVAVYGTTPTIMAVVTSSPAPIVFGTNDTERLRIPSDASGIKFPASGFSTDAYTLDAYVEGTHTILAAHVQGSGTAGTFTLDNSSASNNKITYTRIGNRVLFEGLLVFSAAPTGSPTGALQITNLPFTAGANAGATFNCEFQSLAGTTIYVLGLWSASTSVITFRLVTSAGSGTSSFAPNQVTANTLIRFSGNIGL